MTVAVSSCVPAAEIEADPGLTVTVVATGVGGGGAGAVTVIVAVPLLLALVPVIVAVPAATPVTTPDALTVATAVLPLDHVTLCPVIGLPF